jgi:hypothetical protein
MQILFLVTCANRSRLPQLWSNLSSLYTALLGESYYNDAVKVVVAFNDLDTEHFNQPNCGKAQETWTTLFASIGVEFDVRFFESSMSPPQMWMDILFRLKEDAWFVSCDDDTIWHNVNSLVSRLRHEQPQNTDLVTYGLWDIANMRQYHDWYPQYKVSDTASLVEKHGERAIWCQKWVVDTDQVVYHYSKDTVVCTGTSVVAVSSLMATRSLVDKFASWPKGTRGYDYYLCNSLGFKRKHFFPTFVSHLGVYSPQLDGKLWTQMESPVSNQIQSSLPHDKI